MVIKRGTGREALIDARRLLRPVGALVISCPAYASPAWEEADRLGLNPYWGEIEHFHNFSRERLYSLIREVGLTPRRYAVSERYRFGMEVIAT